MTIKPYSTALALAVASVSLGAQADSSDVIAISDWNYGALYEAGGLQAENLMDEEVFGPTGEEIGSVENLIISVDNRIVAVVAQVGGLWDIGDTHVAVAWNEVELIGDGVRIPVTEDNADDYGLFENEYVTKESLQQIIQVDDDVEAGIRSWKITELLDDYVTLSNGTGYGYVDDVVFSDNGEIQAIIVEPDTLYGTGPYAYPYYSYDHGWRPGDPAYRLPYSENDVGELEPFDYSKFDNS